jgi:secreted trypsin-like serine protease
LFNYDSTDTLVQYSKLHVAGWGSTNKEYPAYSNVLNYVDLKVFQINDCKYLLDEPLQYLLNSNTHVCAGQIQSIGKDACDQDSGGPLMVELNGQWFIYGNSFF